MSETLTKIVHDCATGITSEVPLSSEELVQREIDAAQFEADRIANEAEAARVAELKASAKAKLVAGQPLTEEEAATIVL